jgi:ribosomal protein L16 Arg81 hydroxylase
VAADNIEWMNKLKMLTGDKFWEELTKDDLTIHLTSYFSLIPQLKKFSAQLYKISPHGCQSYLLISFKNKKSPYHHHADPMDLFAIQLMGTKRWNIPVDENGEFLIQKKAQLPYDPDSPNQKYKVFTMTPGDGLFVPFKVPHFVEFIGDEISIHLVLGLTRNFANQVDNYFEFKMRQILRSNEEVYRTLDADEMKEYIEKIKEKMMNYFESFNVDKEYNEYIQTIFNYDIIRTLKG